MVLALVAMTALFVRGAPVQPSEAKPAGPSAATESAGPSPGKLEPTHRLLARHYGMIALADQPDKTAAKQIEDTAAGQIRVVVATVPDPVDSHLGSVFDTQLDALSRAAGASGYALESWSLPWVRGKAENQPPDLGHPGAAFEADAEPVSACRPA